MNPTEARRRIAAIRADKAHPFLAESHPGHGRAVLDMETLYAQAYPEPAVENPLDQIHLQVFVADVLQASGYSVSGVGDDGGGNVTFAAAPANAANVTVIRAVPLTQPTDLPTQGPLDTAAIETRFDQLVMIDQAAAEKLARTLVLPPSAGALGLALPTLVASRFLAANSAASGLEWAAVAAGSIVSAPMQPVVGAASLLLARAALGLGAIEALISGGPDGRFNPVLNADGAIDHVYVGAAKPVAGGDPANTLIPPDGCKATFVGAGVASFTRAAVDIATVPGVVPGYALKADVTTADASLAASDRYTVQLALEGDDVKFLKLGTANALTFTLSFFLRSPLTGTHEVFLQNSAADRSYVGQVTVNAADTWERKSVTVVGDTAGTWLAGASTGLRLGLNLGSGSSFHTTAGAWAAGNFTGTAAGVNLMANTAYDTYITGWQIDPGSQMLPFRGESVAHNRLRCTNYLRVYGGADFAFSNAFLMGGGNAYSTTHADFVLPFDRLMRATPVVTIPDATRFQIRGGASGNLDTTAVSTFARRNHLYMDFTVAAGLTVGDSISLLLDDSSGTGQILINAANS